MVLVYLTSPGGFFAAGGVCTGIGIGFGFGGSDCSLTPVSASNFPSPALRASSNPGGGAVGIGRVSTNKLRPASKAAEKFGGAALGMPLP